MNSNSSTRRRRVPILALLAGGLTFVPVSAAPAQRENVWLCQVAPNPDMTYMLQPNSSFVTFGVPFRTNELGFRDGPIREKTPSTLRIMCVGDSVTFGTGVTNEQTFPNVLESRLQALASPGTVIDVINAGVSAYNARNIRGLMETHLPSLRPDVVVYTFVENDMDDSLSVGPGGWLITLDPTQPPDAPFMMDDFPGLWLIQRKRMDTSGFLSRIKGLFDTQFNEVCATPPPLLLGNHPETLRRWGMFAAELDRMKALCDQAGVPLLIYAFGLRGNAEPIVTRLKGLCDERGLPLATTLPIFEYSTYTDTHSLGYDSHCNPLGNELMADRLQSFLVEQGVLPGDFFARPIPVQPYDERFDPALSASLEAKALSAPSEIDITGGSGIIGVLAGIEANGMMARTGLVRLGGPGDTIQVEVSAPLSSPEAPQWLSAKIEGVAVEGTTEAVAGRGLCSFPIPDGLHQATVEVEFTAHGPARIPRPEDRVRGAATQTVQIHRIARIERAEGI
ncbi:MAG: hypothetical protein HUU16_05365 [Candidatus Omnitrophica bacterium]|nr:hypothetical protein [bacterium]NUN95581.1 hypothetical protein [Candidatus Omnitrophota bacterium]